MTPQWWRKPRRITVVVDNPSWIVPFAQRLVDDLQRNGEQAAFVQEHAQVPAGAIAFYLGCIRITPPDVLSRNQRNLVVHESDLPKGRGFSPLTWQILEGAKRIPVCLLEAGSELDAGPVVYRDSVSFEGHELIGEMRQKLGKMTVALCRRFLAEASPPSGTSQSGDATIYVRRRPADSQLDPKRSIAEQFDLLRVVDNERYPAWFEHRGKRYKIAIEKMPDQEKK
jgi:methionyl-tRNA formyltransferase